MSSGDNQGRVPNTATPYQQHGRHILPRHRRAPQASKGTTNASRSPQEHPVRPSRDAQAPCRNDPKGQRSDEGDELKGERRNEHPDKQRPVFRYCRKRLSPDARHR